MLPYSEIKYEDMIKCLEDIQVYVPSTDIEREVTVPNKSGPDTVMKIRDQQHKMTLVGGDQLTVARMRGAQRIRGNSETSQQRLDGFLPVVEDWHAKMCFLEVNINFINYPREILIYNNNVHALI